MSWWQDGILGLAGFLAQRRKKHSACWWLTTTHFISSQRSTRGVCITSGLSRSHQISFHDKIKKHLTKTNLLPAVLVMKKQTNKKLLSHAHVYDNFSFCVSPFLCLPSPPSPPSLCFRGGCLRQMSVLAQGGASGGQPQPFRATGSQIPRWQGCVPGGHQKGKTRKNKGSLAAEELSSDVRPLCSHVCRLFMHPRSFPTHKASCYCDRRPKNSAGPSTTAPSLWCGEEAASSEGMASVHPAAHPCAIFLHATTHLSHWWWNMRSGSVWTWWGRRSIFISTVLIKEFQLCIF